LTVPPQPGNIRVRFFRKFGRKTMRRTVSLLAIGVCANVLVSLSASAQAALEVTLTRFDCGTSATPTDVGARFSDTYAYNGLKVQLVFSCYLIKHGDDHMVWDTGQPMNAGAVAPKASLVDLLAQVKLKPEQIKYVGISHYHGDHIGQVASFPKSTLLIGKGDWDVLTADKPNGMANLANFGNWISGGGKIEAVPQDKDVFGDGTVVMLDTPGHTPGHHSLLVRLKDKGNVLLSGDVVHFQENYDGNGVPTFNTDRADSLASIDRFRKIAANLKATVIIQHDARDVGKLPAFPAAAK
jgi:N-acyl homoserine lactone hydrolase